MDVISDVAREQPGRVHVLTESQYGLGRDALSNGCWTKPDFAARLCICYIDSDEVITGNFSIRSTDRRQSGSTGYSRSAASNSHLQIPWLALRGSSAVTSQAWADKLKSRLSDS